MKRQTIKTYSLRTIDWFENKVIDWNCAGTQYSVDGDAKQLQYYHFGFRCDGAISSTSGEYVLMYKKLGTKGLLLRNGKLLREINRTYYQSEEYEFPAAFLDYQGRTYLVHCPVNYCQLDIEDAETGEIITNTVERKPSDVFHSRLEVSPDNKYILSKGWYWHPWDGVELFNVEDCLANPTLLDNGRMPPKVSTEISSASFINQEEILLWANNEEPMDEDSDVPIPPGHLAIWNIRTDTISNAVQVKGVCGNILAIDDKRCWDLMDYPKIISLESGEIIDENQEVFSGKQSSSIIYYPEQTTQIAYNRATKQVAIGHDYTIEILTL